MSFLYVLADGDDVGAAVELHLINNDAASAREASSTIQNAIGNLMDTVSQLHTCEVVFSGGDDFLFRIPTEQCTTELLDKLRENYYLTCGRTLSVGVGTSTRSAYLALRKSKLLGKNRVTRES